MGEPEVAHLEDNQRDICNLRISSLQWIIQIQFTLVLDGLSTFERGDQLTEVSHYFTIPLFQQMTVIKNQPVTIINCIVQCWEDDFSFTQSPQRNNFHLNLEHI